MDEDETSPVKREAFDTTEEKEEEMEEFATETNIDMTAWSFELNDEERMDLAPFLIQKMMENEHLFDISGLGYTEKIKAMVDSSSRQSSSSAFIGWMLLCIRSVTRLPQEDDLKMLKVHLLNFSLENFQHRHEMVILWLYEEFYQDANHPNRNQYSYWIMSILERLVIVLNDSEELVDRLLTRFLVDVPALDFNILECFCQLFCVHQRLYTLGLTTLRDLVIFRPGIRQEALSCLLKFATHETRSIRQLAILQTRRCIHDQLQEIRPIIEEHALEQVQMVMNMIQVSLEQVLEKLEFYFSLCARNPSFLERYCSKCSFF